MTLCLNIKDRFVYKDIIKAHKKLPNQLFHFNLHVFVGNLAQNWGRKGGSQLYKHNLRLNYRLPSYFL